MSWIKCEVIEDLITLYVDNLSSEESNKIVEKHLEECDKCKKFLEILKTDEINIDIVDKNNNDVDKVEEKLIRNIKRSLLNNNLIFGLMGAVIAVVFTLDMRIFNGFILLPAIGAIVYLKTRKVWIAPITVGTLKIILETINMLRQGVEGIGTYKVSIFDILGVVGIWGIIFAVLTTIGVIIGILIKKIFLEDNY